MNFSNLTDKLPTSELSKFWSEYKPQIVGGLTGAGLGAAGLGGTAALSGEEDPEVKSKNVKRNLLLGATLGGLGGVGAGAAYKNLHEPASQGGFLSRLFSAGADSTSVQGAALAGGANAAGRRVVNEGIGGKGGAFQGMSIDQMKKQLEEHVAKFSPKSLGSPDAPSSADLFKAEGDARDMLERMTANKSALGRMSQNPTARTFGLNMVDPRAEHAAYQALRPLTHDPEGKEILARLLGPQEGVGGASRAMPALQHALESGPGGEELLRRSHASSALGRGITGAGALTAVELLGRLLNK